MRLARRTRATLDSPVGVTSESVLPTGLLAPRATRPAYVGERWARRRYPDRVISLKGLKSSADPAHVWQQKGRAVNVNPPSATSAPQQPVKLGTTGAPLRRGAARPAPERNPDLAHLGLTQLRGYRSELTAEEGRVSYWRRILQARLDVVRAMQDGVPAVDNLRDVLTGVSVESSRTALLRVVTADDMPILPDLVDLWLREPAPGDRAATVELTLALEEAERRISDYRSALITRLEAATTELIARYREDPSSCLVALPLQPPALA